MNLSGPAGHLEHRLDQATDPRNILAILCHPHPQYGGSLEDGVLATAVQVLQEHHISSLRFNFRGVGASAGSFDGSAEAQDLLAVSTGCAEAYPDHDIWWLGYSFGAAMILRALASQQPQRCLLIAPPNKAMQIPTPATHSDNGGVNVSAIAGDADNYVDPDELQQKFGIETTAIADADHFFSGQQHLLAQAISQWIAEPG